ncbi:MAG: peptidase M22, partial [Ruminococcus sp.]|nr:peptidase M22 [Ruminococcus sp.]
MPLFLGLDTSNYTTSCALYDSASGEVFSCKEMLPVREGERGLRQSDAVFHHTRQLPELMEELFSMAEERYEKYDKITAVAYSYAPREVPGSYMPCFLVGENTARSISAAMGVPVFRTSHQKGHILAALYSCEELGMLEGEREFLAFHVSGGTTDLLLCRPGGDGLFQISEIGRSSDLKAGQCIDRIGVRLGLGFPCGAELER